MAFGQLVIGPAGSGKTTYCNGMQQYMSLTGRKVAVINLDPANDNLPYECAVDVSELVSLTEVQETLDLGPNGGLLYCMEYLEKNLDWLEAKLDPLLQESRYLIFDCPGQVELFSLQASMKRLLERLSGPLCIRLAVVHLVDSHLCSDPSKYLSALLLSLSTMLHLELPHVNVLSKVDLIEQYGRLPFNLDFFTEVQELSYLVDAMGDDRFSQRFRKLSKGLCEVVEDYGLLQFQLLAIEEQASVRRLLGVIDKSNGYVFAAAQNHTPYPPEFVFGAGLTQGGSDWFDSFQNKYMKDDDDMPDIQERQPPA